MELIEEAKQYIKKNNPQTIVFSEKNRQEFFIIYKKIFGKTPECGGCTDKIIENFKDLTAFANGKQLPIMYNGTFNLIEGKTVYDYQTGRHYSKLSETLSEEILWNVLSRTPGESVKMTGLPEDWKERAELHKQKLIDSKNETKLKNDERNKQLQAPSAEELNKTLSANAANNVTGSEEKTDAESSEKEEPETKSEVKQEFKFKGKHHKGHRN